MDEGFFGGQGGAGDGGDEVEGYIDLVTGVLVGLSREVEAVWDGLGRGSYEPCACD